MIVTVYNSNNIGEYRTLIKDLHLDIYYNADYLIIEAERMNGKLEIFCTSQENDVFIYPYLKVEISGRISGYYDLVAPYGYCGPYCNNAVFFRRAETEFMNYVKKEKNIVSEFVRYHFIYNSELQFTQNINNEFNRKLVTFDLAKDWDDIWMNNVSMNNRNYTNKFNREGFKLNISNDTSMLLDFIDIYERTMDNAGASEAFYFDKKYYLDLFKNLDKKIFLATLTLDNKIFSSVLFFGSGKIVQLYLSGRNLKFKNLPSFVPLYINIAKWAKSQGYQVLNVGGGRTSSSEDTLFKFKKRLSNDFREFYIGKRIHNERIYEQLKLEYIDTNGEEKYSRVKDYLQFYRE